MTVNQFRVALIAEDFDRAVACYRDRLGLDLGDLWTDQGQGQIFLAGRATLEIFDPTYASSVDQIEGGESVNGQIRFAFQVPELQIALERALKYGATLVHEPVLFPWNDLNARIRSPEGLQITLFQVMD